MDREDGAELEEGRDISDEASRNRREPRAGRLWQAGRRRSEQVDELGAVFLSVTTLTKKRTELPLCELFPRPHLTQGLGQSGYLSSQLLVLVFRSTRLPASLLQPG